MASDVHKNTDTKVETVSANSVCRQLPQKTAEQGLAAAVAFAEEVQWSLAIRRTISGVGFGEALKLLMNDRDMSVEQMESESGLSVSTVKRLRAGQDASVEQIVAISVALHLPPPVSGDLLRMCGITLDFNNQKNTVYQMILTEYYKEGIEQSQCLPCSMWMCATQNCLLMRTQQNIPMRRLDHKTVWSPLFFEIFSEVRAQEVSPKR